MAENTLTAVKNNRETTRAEPTCSEPCFTPRVDIVETDADLFLYADMPGALPHDIDLRFERGELTLHGKVPPREWRGRQVFGEYNVGDFWRVFQVDESIDATKIEAEFKNGVLAVRLPKQEAAKPKQVPIKVKA